MSEGAVFDCMVFLQAAARKEGPAAACFQLVRDGRLTLYLSPQVLGEVRDVLTRPRTRKKFSALTPENVEVFLRDVESKAILLTDVPNVFALERDPKDEPYLNLAVAAGARYLVSRDKDLLDLMDEQSKSGKEFRERFPDLTVLDPVALLREVSHGSQPQETPEEGPEQRREPSPDQGSVA